jgi:hypothetical protein
VTPQLAAAIARVNRLRDDGDYQGARAAFHEAANSGDPEQAPRAALLSRPAENWAIHAG